MWVSGKKFSVVGLSSSTSLQVRWSEQGTGQMKRLELDIRRLWHRQQLDKTRPIPPRQAPLIGRVTRCHLATGKPVPVQFSTICLSDMVFRTDF